MHLHPSPYLVVDHDRASALVPLQEVYDGASKAMS